MHSIPPCSNPSLPQSKTNFQTTMHDEVRNPFPGLRPFEFEDNHLFFGRDEQTTELTTRLRKNRFVAVVGTSGSGKSSLVRAGLLPELLSGTMSGVGSSWETAIMRPGGDPLTNLANSIIEADLYDPDEEDITSQVRATLTRSGLGLVEAMRQSDLPEGTNFLLVVDQFEEIFRFRRSDDATDEQAAFFVNLLLEASAQSNLPLYIIITMRSDFLGECSQFPRLADTVNEGEFLIPRLNRDQRKEAIIGPVKVAGGGITDRLLLRLLNDIGDDPDQLPILQHALMRTWDLFEEQSGKGDLDLEHYDATGGMTEALSRHADEVYNEQPDEEHKRIAQKLFKSLTEKVDANRGIRRPMSLRELHEICGGEESNLRNVVDSFRRTGCTFLMPAGENAITLKSIIDISHESLMRVWRNLRNWVDEEAQSAKIYRRLADTATLYKEGKAGLYRDPDLQIALSWRKENEPNKTWADRYYSGFEGAMAFLDESHEESIREEREREEARKREVAQAKALAEAQERRAIAQAKTAKIFKFAGACLFVLLCISVYLTIVAVDSKAEVNNKIFQLAARSTATAEKLADEGTLFQSMAWFNDAADYSQENLEAQKYVAEKLKTVLPEVPILTQSEYLTHGIVKYRYSNEGITVLQRANNNWQMAEFKTNTSNLSITELHPFDCSFNGLSSDGEAICFIDNEEELYVDYKSTGNRMKLTPITGLPVFVDFNDIDNNKFVITGQTERTILNVYNLKNKTVKTDFATSVQYNQAKAFYIKNDKILLVGNTRESGDNFYLLNLIDLKQEKPVSLYRKKYLGTISNLDLCSSESYIAFGIKNRDENKETHQIIIHKIESGEIYDEYNTSRTPIIDIAFGPAGVNLAASRDGGDIELANIYSRKIANPKKISSDIKSFTFSPLGTYLIIITSDNIVEFLDTTSLEKALPKIELSSNINLAFFDEAEENLFISTQGSGGMLSHYICYKFIKTNENFISSDMSTEWPKDSGWPKDAIGRPSSEWHGPKELAYDGDESTIIHNDMSDRDPFWIGELGRVCNIKSIKIINRPGLQWKGQMANYLVTILDENKNTVWEEKYLDSGSGNYTAPDSLTCIVDKDVKGKFIKIQCYEDAFTNAQARRTLSFSEIYVQSKGGLDSLKRQELFDLTKRINPLKLNEKGEIESKSIIDLDNELYELNKQPYFSKINNDIKPSREIYLQRLDSFYRQKKWASYISTYDYIKRLYPQQGMGYYEAQFANVLLNIKKYEKSHKLFRSNIDDLKQTELANFIILDSLKNNDVFNQFEDEEIIKLIKARPELPLFFQREKKIEFAKLANETVTQSLPSIFTSDINFSDKFYNSFMIEFEIKNDSNGQIFYMGGENYTDGIALKKIGMQLQLVITNQAKSESKKLNIWVGNLNLLTPDNPWSKHNIGWDHKTKILSYYINGYLSSELQFNGPIGKEHPALNIGGNPANKNYGNIKLESFRIYDDNPKKEEIASNAIALQPIYSLSAGNYISKGKSVNVDISKSTSVLDAYGQQQIDEKKWLVFNEDLNNEKLHENYIFKSCLDYNLGNYTESKNYLLSSIILTGGEVNLLQKHMANLLLKKIKSDQLIKYASQNAISRMNNWKLELLLEKLNKTEQ